MPMFAPEIDRLTQERLDLQKQYDDLLLLFAAVLKECGPVNVRYLTIRELDIDKTKLVREDYGLHVRLSVEEVMPDA